MSYLKKKKAYCVLKIYFYTLILLQLGYLTKKKMSKCK